MHDEINRRRTYPPDSLLVQAPLSRRRRIANNVSDPVLNVANRSQTICTETERSSSSTNHLVTHLTERPATLRSLDRSAELPRHLNQALTPAQRQQRRRDRLRAERLGLPIVSTQVASQCTDQIRDEAFDLYWRSANRYFTRNFIQNQFGHACSVCDRLWFKSDLREVKSEHQVVLEPVFGQQARSFKCCAYCIRHLNLKRLPTLSKTNGFAYPPKQAHLPPLNPITKRLISPRVPFMQIRRLRRVGQYSIIGQVINVPIDVNQTITHLPRSIDDDHAFNVNFKRKLIHKSSYVSGFVRKSDMKIWLEFLSTSQLFQYHRITVNWSALSEDPNSSNNDTGSIEEMTPDACPTEISSSRQHTLRWNEEHVLDIAPGQNSRPINLSFDQYAEEMSFPEIYYGTGRYFPPHVKVTPYLIANSEIRRQDRRGATPEHVLYMAMKVMRMRVVESLYNTFQATAETENFSRRMLEDRSFLDDCVQKQLAFLKSIPNSAQYLSARKRDLFAMMRQLGKPTMFLTLSANEVKWPDLLLLLHNLNDLYKDVVVNDPLQDLTATMRSHLVNEDPVVCCIYFHKLVDTIMNMLQTKRDHNPFGKYRVKDFFIRIEFQHRGSPHAHILLWLNNDPKEVISENMPLTIQLVTDLCSVSEEDLNSELYSNQVHKHTFTCYKRGEETCRFGIPFWPMPKTTILMPIIMSETEKRSLRKLARKTKDFLSTRVYDTFDTFLRQNGLNLENYLQMIRATLKKPTLFFKRNMQQIMTNTFNPWIGVTLKSNMDLQFILDEYSCATYIADYVNKTNRGSGNLYRELVKLNESYPELSNQQLMKRLGSKILNTVELSAQEAAWYLTRQKMTRASREIIYIPTCHPCERQKSLKKKAQLNKEGIGPDSTDIWTKNLIQKYEIRPQSLRNICLADFASMYSRQKKNQDVEDLDDPDMEVDINDQSVRSNRYYQRKQLRVIRYRRYDQSDPDNYKRELVTLFVPFNSEQIDILDRQKFLSLYTDNLDLIIAKRQEYDTGCNIEQACQELEALDAAQDRPPVVQDPNDREAFVRDTLPDNVDEDFNDFDTNRTGGTISTVRTRTNVMTKEEYCKLMRTTNDRQRELILEVVHRANLPGSQPIQIFFTGPAGCGKTYVLKLIMETINRFCQSHNTMQNAYVACASTGKAAVNLGGSTIQSAFHVSTSRAASSASSESIQRFRLAMADINYIVVDEVSMVGSDLLHKVNSRLQQVTGAFEEPFGGMNIIFCGDFRQLPPVNATPVYKGRRNLLEAAYLWQTLDYFPLHQVMRQSDVVFSSMLTKLGDGTPFTPEETQLIQSRFRTVQWCDENLNGVIRLFHRNTDVDNYNRKAVRDSYEIVADDLIIGYSSNEQLNLARSKINRMPSTDTGNLKYLVSLALGYPYMLTCNIDVEDGLVNGAIGIIRHIDKDDQDLVTNTKVWLEFPEKITGARSRSKSRHLSESRRDIISPTWTLISSRTVSINLGGKLRCKRSQLPLTAACALTIHKSQGGTFDRAVVSYNGSQQNQLVYVGLSRVKSIDGLYLINEKNDFTFHHAKGNSTPSVAEIRTEYLRLNQHPLATITAKVKEFMALGQSSGETYLLLCTINAQSLVAHFRDIESDMILKNADILVITETWMNQSPVSIQGFKPISCSHFPTSNPRSTEDELERRSAGGVAIFHNESRHINLHEIQVSQPPADICGKGDLALIRILVNPNLEITLAGVYLHPNTSQTVKQSILHHFLSSRDSICTSGPAILTGDFNSNINSNEWLEDLLRVNFGMKYVPNPYPTTLGNSSIDLTFTRELDVACMSYVCYFSYHRPIFNRVRIS